MFSKRNIVLFTFFFSVVLFIIARRAMMPFVIAFGFAYVFNPVVKLIIHKTKLNRVWAVTILYVVLFGTLSVVASLLISQIIREANQFSKEVSIGEITQYSEGTIKRLPEWNLYGQTFGFQSVAASITNSLILTAGTIKESLLPIFTGAVGYLLQVLVFLVASFYFLKDGPVLFERTLKKLPSHYEKEFYLLAKKINEALGGYLRGQILLIIIMAVISSIFLSILGVKFAIILGIATGFLELIPLIGPVGAGAMVAGTAFITGENRLGLDPTTLLLVIVTFYFIARQFEDYFIIPQVLGRLTRLHPLAVLFSVLVGGAIAGPMGFILAVPVAASLRILLEYAWERSN